MIGVVALITVLMALSLVAAWLVSWPVLGLWQLVTRRPGQEPRWARWNLALLFVPLFVGGLVAIGAVWPASSIEWSRWACHCEPPAANLFHLCFAHPQTALPLLPFAAFTLVWFAWRPTLRVVEVVRRLRAARRLMASSALEPSEIDGVFLARLSTPNAVTVGLFRPRVLVDRQWWGALRPTERRIVAAHEIAHVRCRDPLGHTLGLLLTGLVARPLSAPMVDSWLGWAERRADRHAASKVEDAARVAELLVDQKRAEAVDLSLVPSFGGGGLEQRVMALLEGARDKNPRLGSHLGLALAGGVVAWLILVISFGFQIHVAVERLLQILS